jgi:hypothetical protein
MFCDLVGSTELAAALDVEDWRNLVNTYLDEASKAVSRAPRSSRNDRSLRRGTGRTFSGCC